MFGQRFSCERAQRHPFRRYGISSTVSPKRYSGARDGATLIRSTIVLRSSYELWNKGRWRRHTQKIKKLR